MTDCEAGMEFPKIRALEPLFRIAENFLWDDAGIITSGNSTHNGYLTFEPAASSSIQTRNMNSCTTTDEESSTDHTIPAVRCDHKPFHQFYNFIEYLCVEELELVQQLDTLGLPLSFGTSKSRNNVTSRSKRKGVKTKSASHEKERNKTVPHIMAFSQMENTASSTSLHESTNMSSCLYAMEEQVDAPPCHEAKEHSRADLQFDESKSRCTSGSINETGMKPVLDEVSDANSGTFAKLEFSPNTVSFELHAEVLGSLSLISDGLPEEILEDACSRAQFHHDGDLLNKHDRCLDESSTSCCSMHLKSDTQTLQSSVSAEFSLRPFGDHYDNFICEHGDWWVIWDPFYENNYFFNVQTLELTWYPPLGLEQYAFSWSNTCREETREGAAEKNAASKHSCSSMSVVTDSLPENGVALHFTDSLPENGGGLHVTDKQPDADQPLEISAKMEAGIDFASHYTTIGNGNTNVQLSLYTSFVIDDMKDEANECKDLDEQKENQQGDMRGSYYGYDCKMPTTNENGNTFIFPESYASSSVEKVQELTWHRSVSLLKYWRQRYSLFSRFDNGIKMDEESWFSVTPEQIAKHHAFRCGAGTIIDCFVGVGGNAIQFAMRGNHVIAIDVDPQKIDFAHHNAVIYGVGGRINFIKGDFFKIAPSLKGDVVFLAPPWGGPDYVKMKTYDLRSLKPREGYYLFKIASKIAAKVVMFLPRNVNFDQLVELSLSAYPPWKLEIEKNYLNGKLKSITAYFDRTTLN